jgi:hypothetical protein
MNDTITIGELERRWEETLAATEAAVIQYPGIYRQIKFLAGEIATKTLDIGDYPNTAEKLGSMLRTMDTASPKNIFHFFSERVSPASITKLKLLRIECMDLKEQLEAFDTWRMETHHLRVLK